nr:TIGR03885 family FMN-dependent LLM class oxidoreductase [Verrucomicrobium sp. BvORR106]
MSTTPQSDLEISYHASHEQFAPSALLRWVQKAEKAGFNGFFSSDHFHPWSEAQGQAGFSWAWMGAALQATSLPGAMICCPGYRYHPAVVAQAAATLSEMYEGRYWLAIGSGEALNEKITGQPWPLKDIRNARLKECADIIRALWAGDTVTHRGLVTVEEAKLYTLPRQTPLLIGAAITEATAEWMGSWADGLITVSKPPEELRKMVEAFHRGGGAGKPLYLKSGLSYAPTKQEARLNAHQQWRSVAFQNNVLAELRTPAEFDAIGKHVRPEDMDDMIRISDSLEQHREWIQNDIDAGFTKIVLHNIGRNQEEFIDVFGEKVLPAFL